MLPEVVEQGNDLPLSAAGPGTSAARRRATARLADDGLGNAQALHLATGQGADRPVRVARVSTHRFDRPRHPLGRSPVRPGGPPAVPVEPENRTRSTPRNGTPSRDVRAVGRVPDVPAAPPGPARRAPAPGPTTARQGRAAPSAGCSCRRRSGQAPPGTARRHGEIRSAHKRPRPVAQGGAGRAPRRSSTRAPGTGPAPARAARSGSRCRAPASVADADDADAVGARQRLDLQGDVVLGLRVVQQHLRLVAGEQGCASSLRPAGTV